VNPAPGNLLNFFSFLLGNYLTVDMLKKYLMKANSLLEKSLGFISRNKSEDVSDEVQRLKDTVSSIDTLLNS
jgi:hypothetical protein